MLVNLNIQLNDYFFNGATPHPKISNPLFTADT